MINHEQLINSTLNWCVNRFGLFGKTKPYIFIDQTTKYAGWFNLFPDNSSVIGINPNNCKTVIDIIDTVIHEYVHFTQFKDFFDYTNYIKTPEIYEFDAVNFADENKEICFNQIKDQIKS